MSKLKPGGLPPQKSFYPLEEASALAGYTVSDLVHYGGQSRISLVIGVPDRTNLHVFDGYSGELREPFVLIPQLLALSAAQCQKVELQGRTSQSDFPVGYLIESDGALKKLFPNYGRRDLNHQWVVWRLVEAGNVCLLDVSPDRLFVTRDDLLVLMGEGDEPSASPQPVRKERKARPSSGDHADAQAADFGGGHSRKSVEQDDVNENDPVAVVRPKSVAAVKKSDEPVEVAPKPSLRGPTILRLKQVMERTGLSRSTVYDRMSPNSPRHDPSFPRQISLGGDAVGWVDTEVDAWLQRRIAAGRS